jgi:hypothetical protein
MMTVKMWKAAFAAASAMCVTGAQAGMMKPKPKELTQAVQAFLADHGDLCLAMYTWPRDVTPEDRQANSNEAVQMPVLERLGIVRSVELREPAARETPIALAHAQPSAPVSPQLAPPEPTKRYSLTPKGKQYFQRKRRITLDSHSQPEVHDADFCVAHLTLDKVIRWSPPEPVHDRLETVVKYTYHIKAAPFLSDPEARKVFPMVDRIVHGAGSLMMAATVQLQDGRWVPVLPGQ